MRVFLVMWDSTRVWREMEPVLNVLPLEPLLILERRVQLVVVSSVFMRDISIYHSVKKAFH